MRGWKKLLVAGAAAAAVMAPAAAEALSCIRRVNHTVDVKLLDVADQHGRKGSARIRTLINFNQLWASRAWVPPKHREVVGLGYHYQTPASQRGTTSKWFIVVKKTKPTRNVALKLAALKQQRWEVLCGYYVGFEPINPGDYRFGMDAGDYRKRVSKDLDNPSLEVGPGLKIVVLRFSIGRRRFVARYRVIADKTSFPRPLTSADRRRGWCLRGFGNHCKRKKKTP